MKKLALITFIIVLPLLSSGQIFNPSDASICKGGNTSFKSGSLYPTATYKWFIRHKGAWDTLKNVSPFSGATTTTLSLTNVSDTLNGDSFKCQVTFSSSVVGTSKAAKLTVSGSSSKPTSASASVNPVDCPGGETQLSVSGSLSGGSSWKWYSGTCGKNAVSSLVKPNATTTYYVRAEGACGDTSSCVSITVVVTNTNSTAPSSVTSTPGTICSGQSSTLAVVGGSLGSGAIWKWYSGGTCSVLVDSQGVSSLSVSPVSTSTYSVKADGKCGSTVCKNVTVKVNQLPVMNAGNDTALCKGLSIRLNATSAGSNTYRWTPNTGLDDTTALNPNANPAVTTTYILTVKNADNCVKSDTILVKVNTLPVAKASKDTAVCKSGSAKLTASGGTYYDWFPVTGLNASNISNPLSTPQVTTKYKVTVTDLNQCSDTAFVTINVNPLPTLKLISSQKFCCDYGNISLGSSTYGSPTGGSWTCRQQPSYINGNNFLTSTACDPNTSQTYTLVYTYQEPITTCINKDSTQFTIHSLPKIVAKANDTNVCEGAMVTLFGEGGTSYSWSNGVKNGVPFVASKINTTYFLEGKDTTNCYNRDTIKLSVNSLPDISTTKNGVTISSNQNGATYQWLDCNKSYAPLTGETKQSYTATKNGEYAVIVKLNDCSDTSACVLINTIDVNTFTKNSNLRVYPNPTNGKLTIESGSPIESVSISNLFGQIINVPNPYTGNLLYSLDMSLFSKGIYFITVKTKDGSVTQKILKD